MMTASFWEMTQRGYSTQARSHTPVCDIILGFSGLENKTTAL